MTPAQPISRRTGTSPKGRSYLFAPPSRNGRFFARTRRQGSTYGGPRLRRWTQLVGKSPVALLNDLGARLPYGPGPLRPQARS
jgi:hypothetical protein